MKKVKTNKKGTLARVAERIGYMGIREGGDIEKRVADLILSPPKDVAETSDILELFGHDYEPGTFKLSERKNSPGFLFDEPISNYRDWVFDKVEHELRLLSSIPEMNACIETYGSLLLLKEDVYNVLHFRVSKDLELHDCVYNQEYSDVFRRIITLLLKGKVFQEYHTHKEFNRLGYQVAIPILRATSDYDLCDRLKQSISSGLIGIDMKDEVAATSPLSRKGIIALMKMESIDGKIDYVRSELDRCIKQGLAIDFLAEYENEVLNSKSRVNLAWFTDDYIPTIFEMKFIEEQLKFNERLKVYIIPRRFRYGNDASYSDVQELIKEPVFQGLQDFLAKNRLHICSSGPDMGTLNGFRISSELAKILFLCNIVIVTGARSYEMAQGIRKLAYFSGIAVCRRYTESITGIDMDSGASIFVRQDPGVPSFSDFRAREWRRILTDKGKSIPVAGMTTKDYARAIRSSNYGIILNRFNNNRYQANLWILGKAKEQGITFAQVIESVQQSKRTRSGA